MFYISNFIVVTDAVNVTFIFRYRRNSKMKFKTVRICAVIGLRLTTVRDDAGYADPISNSVLSM